MRSQFLIGTHRVPHFSRALCEKWGFFCPVPRGRCLRVTGPNFPLCSGSTEASSFA